MLGEGEEINHSTQSYCEDYNIATISHILGFNSGSRFESNLEHCSSNNASVFSIWFGQFARRAEREGWSLLSFNHTALFGECQSMDPTFHYDRKKMQGIKNSKKKMAPFSIYLFLCHSNPF